MSTPTITAKEVKELRDRTGAGMMDCKARARGDRRRHRQGRRAPARQGSATRPLKLRRPRGHRGHRPVLHPRQRQGRRARRGRLQHRLRRPQRRLHRVRARRRAAHRRLADRRSTSPRTTSPRRPSRPSCACSSSRPPTSPRTSGRKIAEGKLSKWLEEVVLLNQEHVNARQARGQDDRAAARRAVGDDRRERRDPALRPLRGRRVGSRGGDGRARLQARPAQAVGRGADGRPRLRHRPRARPGDRRARSSACTTAASRSRSWSAPATSTAAWRAPPRAWTARPRDYMGMLATVLNALTLQDALENAGRPHARAVGDHDLRGRRALHPPPRDAPPREGPRRDLRRRHRQPVLHHRHRRRAARARDPRRGDPDGQERRRGRLHGRPARRTPSAEFIARDHAHARRSSAA